MAYPLILLLFRPPPEVQRYGYCYFCGGDMLPAKKQGEVITVTCDYCGRWGRYYT